MIELVGKYSKDCKIFTDLVEDSAIGIIQQILDNPVFEGAKVRCMPDTHAGEDAVIGFTCPLGKYINPNYVSADIGCTVSLVSFSEEIPVDSYPIFENRIRRAIPFGKEIRKVSLFDEKEFIATLNNELQSAYNTSGGLTEDRRYTIETFTEWMRGIGINPAVFYKSIGTVGGGNHFIEYGIGDNNCGVVTIHTGSRNLGQKVCKKWLAIARDTSIPKAVQREIAIGVRRSGIDKKKIKAAIDEGIAVWKKKNARPYGYLSGDDMRAYLTDVVIAQTYAHYNHQRIIREIKGIYKKIVPGAVMMQPIYTRHNYIDFARGIIRKGAVSAEEGEKFLLPFNMRDGIAICIGKGNSDWNYSAPHGAGRIMSRGKAKSSIGLQEFMDSMEGIYSTSVNSSTIDESPMAYKPMDRVVKDIAPTCEIISFIKPKINMKASD